MRAQSTPLKLLAVFAAVACASAHAEGGSYGIDPTHTFAYFEVMHKGLATLRGRFDRKDGSMQFDRAGKTGRAEISVDLSSVSTGVPALDEALRGKEFFDVAGHPQASFSGDHFGFVGDAVSEVTGTLTFRGRTQALTLKATRFNCYTSPLFRREVCGGDFEASLRPREWGIGIGTDGAEVDQVRLLVQVEAIRQ